MKRGEAVAMPRFRVTDLWDEIVYLAYHLHWPLESVVDLEHGDRRDIIRSTAALNQRAWEELMSQ